MSSSDYLDFDLMIERSGEAYRARVLNSPAGQAQVEFKLPFSLDTLAEFVTRVADSQTRDVRRRPAEGGPAPEAGARDLGGQLFEAVFDGEVRSSFRRSLDEAERQESGLRVLLRLREVPELADVPWEMLFDKTRSRFLVLSVETPIVRYLELPEASKPLSVEPPVRLLAVISNPEGVPPLDVEREWSQLQEAVKESVSDGLLALDRLPAATVDALQKKLRRSEVHVLHFIGHGTYDSGSGQGFLLMEDDQGRARPVSAVDLGVLLHDHKPLRLVTLNACQGARTSLADPFAGVAQHLVLQGIPAVLAMQFEVSDRAAIKLASSLYGALADGYPVDAALAEARKSVSFDGQGVEWVTPALYMRSSDGRLFEVSSALPARSAKPPTKAKRKPRGEARTEPGKELADYSGVIADIAAKLEAGRLIWFIGADLPEELTGAPSRQALADGLAKAAGLEPGQSLPSVSQQVMRSGNRWEFTNGLIQMLGGSGLRPGVFYEALASVLQVYEPELIVTTAYHRHLETALEMPASNVVAQEMALPFVTPNEPVLLKLYGDIQQVESLVVTEQDVNGLVRGRMKPAMVDELRRAFQRNSVLFLGFDLDDPAVTALFDEVSGGKFQLPSYAIWSGVPDPEVNSFRTNRGLEVLDVDPVALLRYLRGSDPENGAPG